MDVFYKCNPAKNDMCPKTSCFINGGPCTQTKHKEFTDDPDHVRLVMPLNEGDYEAIVGRNREERRKNARKR